MGVHTHNARPMIPTILTNEDMDPVCVVYVNEEAANKDMLFAV